jgi:hypothetical protein
MKVEEKYLGSTPKTGAYEVEGDDNCGEKLF